MKKIVLLMFMAISYSSLSYAEGVANGQVTNLVVNRFNHAIVEVENLNTSNAPSCATLGRFSVDIETEYGQAMFSMLLAADSMDKDVIVVGSNVCDLRSDSESIRFVQFRD